MLSIRRALPFAVLVAAACAVNVVPRDSDEFTNDAGPKRVDAGHEDAGVEDAGTEDAGTEDGGMDAGPTHPAVPDAWGTPVALASLNTSNLESQPAISGDMRRLCFMSDRPGNKGKEDIWCSFRDSAEAPWEPPVNQGNLNSASLEWMPGLSDDGSELYFSSDRQYMYQMNIYRATWIAQVGGYGNVVRVDELNTANNVWSASAQPSRDGLSIYFESFRAGGYGESDLYVATRDTPSSTFNEPLNLSPLNSGYNDGSPSPSSDGKVLLFASARPGGATQGSSLWRSNMSASGTWSTPVPVNIEGASGFTKMSTPRILADGSLLFSGAIGSAKDDLFIAPPKW